MIAVRALTAAAATLCLGLSLAPAAQAVTPHPTPSAPAPASSENPFRWMDLQGLKAEYRFMCPAGTCVDYWSLVLTEDVAAKHYAGGRFFAYAPASGEFGFFLDTDIAVRTTDSPDGVRLVDSPFTRHNARFEIRYGNPDQPRKARVVATATTWM
ncbi:hypothetical protein [Streptomyces olivoverticillatus]|uniref:hypothetical protein n=1 Tax=Streptomyces olivoverticillatus TaxID=66427 RepID=UPI00160C0E9F|nr:hypothetical protein [Streptomyces olivoverticillatus]